MVRNPTKKELDKKISHEVGYTGKRRSLAHIQGVCVPTRFDCTLDPRQDANKRESEFFQRVQSPLKPLQDSQELACRLVSRPANDCSLAPALLYWRTLKVGRAWRLWRQLQFHPWIACRECQPSSRSSATSSYPR